MALSAAAVYVDLLEATFKGIATYSTNPCVVNPQSIRRKKTQDDDALTKYL